MLISSHSWLVVHFFIASSEWQEGASPSCPKTSHACLLQTSSSRSVLQQKQGVHKIIEDPDIEPMLTVTAKYTGPPSTWDLSMRPPRTFRQAPKVSFIDAGGPLKFSAIDGSVATGSMAALNENGYKQVSSLKSNAEMGTYIRRVISSMGLSVTDEAGLTGVVPYYSGMSATQSFAALKHEIISAPKWIGHSKAALHSDGHESASFLVHGDHSGMSMVTGASATLNEDGYESVAKLKNNAEMKTFIQRVVDDMGGRVVDEPGFNGVVPYYSGQRATQTFAALRAEISSAPTSAKAWVEMDSDAIPDASTQNGGSESQSESDESIMDTAIGSTTSLDERGYKAVSKLRSNSEMGAFIQRLVSQMGGRIVDEAGFQGVVPFYSGQQAKQSFEALRKEIQSSAKSNSAWVEIEESTSSSDVEENSQAFVDQHDEGASSSGSMGAEAPLSEKGYKTVSGLRSNTEMRTFMQRVVADMGARVVDEAGFSGVIPYYSGVRSTQSLEALKQEIRSTPDSRNPWVEFSSPISAMETSIATAGTRYQRRANLEDAGASGAISGSSVSLDEEGYKVVSSLRNDAEMKTFIERVVESMDGVVGDEAGLNGVVPYYSGVRSTQSLQALKKEILAAHWVDR